MSHQYGVENRLIQKIGHMSPRWRFVPKWKHWAQMLKNWLQYQCKRYYGKGFQWTLL